MKTCAACSASLRPTARFCTRCGAAVASLATHRPAELAVGVAQPSAANAEGDELEPDSPDPPRPPHSASADIPARVPSRRRVAPPRARSAAATWALITGIVPLAVSIIGNLATVPFREGGGAMPLIEVIVVSAVFIVNAALLALCAVTGFRALRETSNGITRGRLLAIAGLAAGGVNLVLWTSGLLVTVVGFAPVLV
jgi:hypothetical protein